jgi:hypothetical protein
MQVQRAQRRICKSLRCLRLGVKRPISKAKCDCEPAGEELSGPGTRPIKQLPFSQSPSHPLHCSPAEGSSGAGASGSIIIMYF